MNEEMKNNANVAELAPGVELNMEAAAPSVGDHVQGLDGANGEYTHRFKKPFEWEGQRYETIKFDFARLTGRDMNAIEREMQAVGESAYTAETSKVYQCRIAARAAKILPDVLEAMPMGDYHRITNAARNFLLATGY